MVLPALSTLTLERQGEHVLLAMLNRPETLNAINTQMGHDLLALWTWLTVESHDVRAVVLTGSGDRAFCAGGDLKERNGMNDDEWRVQHELFERAFLALVNCPVPVIAAVNGAAFGGGCETALACDFVYASREARFALSETRLGIMPGGGGTQTLPRAVGSRRAKELIFSAKPFTATEAALWGLVNSVCAPDDLLSHAIETARAISSNAPMSVRQAKKSIDSGLNTDLVTGYRFEIEAYNRLVSTVDRLEGVKAFNQKRTPVFVGR